jgi:hypothetical protein
MMKLALTQDEIKDRLPVGGLIGTAGFLLSPEPLRLAKSELRTLTSLGHPLAMFQAACERIYRRSVSGSAPGWIAALLDVGKPGWLIDVQRSERLRGVAPRVIRPDLLLAEGGFALSELDSVPGGMGVSAWLAGVFADAGFPVLGGRDGMLDGFRKLLPQGGTILVSAEAGDYRPEMTWLAGQLGAAWQVASAEGYQPTPGEDLYRFFELFDWESVPAVRELAQAAMAGTQAITPPFKPHFEEKLWLALLWSPGLRRLWEEELRGSQLRRIRELVPFGWVVDPTPLPPQAALPRLEVNSWDEVLDFSQKQRRLVLKISGFNELAWGSRGVFIGHDLPGDEWRERLTTALASAATQPWLVQEFRETRLVEHPYFDPASGEVRTIVGRARICPYYFTDSHGRTELGGCLATIVPSDKKKIHGMKDGILVPVVAE